MDLASRKLNFDGAVVAARDSIEETCSVLALAVSAFGETSFELPSRQVDKISLSAH